MVPRHQEIVARILGHDHAGFLTKVIGCSEIAMAVWILTAIKPKLNVIVQVLIIASMNIFEFFLVSDLLLWGRMNIVFAFLFIIVILYNEFSTRI